MSPALPAVSFMEREIVSHAVISIVKWEPVRAEQARSRSNSGDAPQRCSGKDRHEATGLEQDGEAERPSFVPMFGWIGRTHRRPAPARLRAADGQRIVAIAMTRCSTRTILPLSHGAPRFERLDRLSGIRLGLAYGVEVRFPALVRSHHHAFSRG